VVPGFQLLDAAEPIAVFEIAAASNRRPHASRPVFSIALT
jgi:hypothetical protein